MTVEELYRSVKAQVRRSGLRESLYVIWAYSQYLQVTDFELPRDIEANGQFLDAQVPQAMIAEWTLEQIAREAVVPQRSGNVRAGGRGVPGKD